MSDTHHFRITYRDTAAGRLQFCEAMAKLACSPENPLTVCEGMRICDALTEWRCTGAIKVASFSASWSTSAAEA